MITHATRRASFDKSKPEVGSRQREVLDLLEANPDGLTAWQLAENLNRHVYVVRPRLTELRSLGLIHNTGTKYHAGTDRNEAIWAVVRPPQFDSTGQGILFDGTAYTGAI